MANDVHRLISGDRVQRATGGSELETRGDSLLDKSVVLFHDVVHVRRYVLSACESNWSVIAFTSSLRLDQDVIKHCR